ncbi:MAG: SH3 domain-containing protein [Alphaproteobacteria bacterium]
MLAGQTGVVSTDAAASAGGGTEPQVQAALSPTPATKVPPPIVATGRPVPRWVTIKANRVNVRHMPGLEHPILWTYVKAGTPVRIIEEYYNWRKIEDLNGTKGWVKAAMLDGRRNVMVTGRVNQPLLDAPHADARTIAYAAPGLVAKVVSCAGTWCVISSRGYEGYVERSHLWGVEPEESVN